MQMQPLLTEGEGPKGYMEIFDTLPHQVIKFSKINISICYITVKFYFVPSVCQRSILFVCWSEGGRLALNYHCENIFSHMTAC